MAQALVYGTLRGRIIFEFGSEPELSWGHPPYYDQHDPFRQTEGQEKRAGQTHYQYKSVHLIHRLSRDSKYPEREGGITSKK